MRAICLIKVPTTLISDILVIGIAIVRPIPVGKHDLKIVVDTSGYKQPNIQYIRTRRDALKDFLFRRRRQIRLLFRYPLFLKKGSKVDIQTNDERMIVCFIEGVTNEL